LQQEEKKKRKIELKHVKENMWKKWRTAYRKGEEYKPEKEKNTQEKLESLRPTEETKRRERERLETEKI
jgi:hypothetical protein